MHDLIHLWLLCFRGTYSFSPRTLSQQPILRKKERCSWCHEQRLCEDREPFSFIHGCLTLTCAPGSFRLQLAHPSCQPSNNCAFNWSKNYWWQTCLNSGRIQSQSASLNDKEITVWSDCPRLLRMSASQLDKKDHCNSSEDSARKPTPFCFSPNWLWKVCVEHRGVQSPATLESIIACWQIVWAIEWGRKETEVTLNVWVGCWCQTVHSRLICWHFHTTNHVQGWQRRAPERKKKKKPWCLVDDGSQRRLGRLIGCQPQHSGYGMQLMLHIPSQMWL